MKKTISILLLVLLIAGVITSCDNKLSNNSNETVSVTFSSDDGSRDLTSSNPLFDVDALYWKYTAVKAADDGTGLTQGATSEQRWIYGGSASNSTQTGLGVVGGFSQGLWNFTLYGYRYSDDAGYKLVCQGTTTTSIKFGTANNVNVQAKPITTGSETGTLKINPITFTPNQGSVTKLTCNYTVTLVGGSQKNNGNLTSEIEIGLNPGSYNVEIKFVDDNGIVYARGSKLVTICSNLTTTLSGSLNELITSTGVGATPKLNPIGGVIYYVALPGANDTATYTFYDEGGNVLCSGSSFTVDQLVNATHYTVSGEAENDRFFVLYTQEHLFTEGVCWGFDGSEESFGETLYGKSNTTTILKFITDNNLLDPENLNSSSDYRNCGEGLKYVWDYIIAFNDIDMKSANYIDDFIYSSINNETKLYDWYIPSSFEMNILYTNYTNMDKLKTKIDSNLILSEEDLSGKYITSTLSNENPNNFYFGFDWNSGNVDTVVKKSDSVKCVIMRSF